LQEFEDKINWFELSKNTGINWTTEFILKYSDKWIETYLEDVDYTTLRKISKWYGISENNSIPWSIDFINQFDKKLDWKILSANPSLPWTDEFVKSNIEKLDFENLSANSSFLWSIQFIEIHKKELNWQKLARNENLPWSLDFLIKFQDLFQLNSYIQIDEFSEMSDNLANNQGLYDKAFQSNLTDDLVDSILDNSNIRID
jgi:hypothetical protein